MPSWRPAPLADFWVNQFRGFDLLRKKAKPPIDLAQSPLTVLIVGVFTPVAVARSPRHYLRHSRTFSGCREPVFIFEALQTAGVMQFLLDVAGSSPCGFLVNPLLHIASLSCKKVSPQFCSGDSSAIHNELGAILQEYLGNDALVDSLPF